MEQPVQKSGMPRGCLVALIVVGALILILGVLMATCYFNKDKFIKWSIRTGVTYAQTELAKNPDGIDTVKFNALVTGFMQQLETTELNDDQITKIGPILQGTISDKHIDAQDIYKLSDVMVALFPNLDSLKIAPSGEQLSMPADSVGQLPGDSTAAPLSVPADTVDGH